MERRFACTACGKCCFGWLPLTLDDALAHAGRFPLAVVWTPVKPASRAFATTARIGLTVRLADRKQVAVRIAPTAYLPPSMACPELKPDGLCAIHADKPSRCRTMPFFPYRAESDQADLLLPRSGWACEVGASAPVVYRDKAVVERGDFDREHEALLGQTPVLKAYGEALLGSVPGLPDALARAAAKPGGGHVALGFASLLRRLNPDNRNSLAEAQLTVLAAVSARVSDPDYARNYADWTWELERLLGR